MSDDNGGTTITRADLEREIRHLREKLDLANVEREKALKLQGLEYERRLEVLNDAHARAEKAVQMTVPRDLYDTFIGQFNKWKEDVAIEFATMKATTAANARFFTILVTVITVAFAALSMWARTK